MSCRYRVTSKMSLEKNRIQIDVLCWREDYIRDGRTRRDKNPMDSSKTTEFQLYTHTIVMAEKRSGDGCLVGYNNGASARKNET